MCYKKARKVGKFSIKRRTNISLVQDLFTITKIKNDANCLLTHLRTLGSFSGQIKGFIVRKVQREC